MPAASLIGSGGTDYHTFLARNQALSVSSGVATLHANRPGLADILCNCHQLRHGLKRIPEVIHIKSGNDDTFTIAGQGIGNPDKLLIEELPFIDSNHLGHIVDRSQNLIRTCDRQGFNPPFGVRHNLRLRISIIDRRFEDLHFLPGNLCSPQPANELFALSTEH